MPAAPMTRNVLPPGVSPVNYKLHIRPNFEDFSFTGSVQILLDISQPVQSIKLNAIELEFTSVAVEVVSSKVRVEVKPSDVQYNAADMTATIPLSAVLGERAVLHIEYTGAINDRLAGFYRSRYTADEREVTLATTQFEAVDARRALPCWDEPAHKATFDVTITAPSHMVSLSNTDVIRNEPSADGALTTWTYETTPKMSTYLLAWTIGELDCISETVHLPYSPERATRVSIYAPKGKASQGQFALQVSLKVLPLYEKFFSHGYTLSKLDLVAIPDFACGAMENWGLITYREATLLCDESSSASHRQRVAVVVAHELAHQWFGNLVTMEWWKELWLNESFATYMEYWAVDKIFPEWNVFTQFAQDEGSRALHLDALRSSHPVEVDVCNAQEIDDIFDAISYSKGGSIVRMAIEYIGAEAFQSGISAYIAHFVYRNANTVDLWNFLGKAAGKDLAPIMEAWTAQQGYPFLNVAATARSEGTVELTITQNRFLATGDATEEENATIWKIPLLVCVPERGESQVLVDGRVTVTKVNTTTWVKVNSRQAAFCRVRYDADLLQALVPPIRSKAISSLDRLGIVSDYYAFAKGGNVCTTETLQLLKHFAESEDDFTVWSAIADCESDIRIIMDTQGEAALSKFNAYCQSLYSTAMARVTYTPAAGESQNVTQLRGVLFSRLVVAQDPTTLDVARKLFANRSKVAIPADIRRAVFSVYVEEGGVAAIDTVKELIQTTTDAVERSRYLQSLASGCPSAVSVSDLFTYALSDKVRSQDTMYLFAALASNSKVKVAYASELMTRWSVLMDKLPGMLVGRVMKFVELGASEQVVKSMEKFWEGISETDRMMVGRSFQQGLEGVRNNAKWAARDAQLVVASL